MCLFLSFSVNVHSLATTSKNTYSSCITPFPSSWNRICPRLFSQHQARWIITVDGFQFYTKNNFRNLLNWLWLSYYKTAKKIRCFHLIFIENKADDFSICINWKWMFDKIEKVKKKKERECSNFDDIRHTFYTLANNIATACQINVKIYKICRNKYYIVWQRPFFHPCISRNQRQNILIADSLVFEFCVK